jgi:hypothetical protein
MGLKADTIVEAYRKVGKPRTRGVFVEDNNGEITGICPISATLMAKMGSKEFLEYFDADKPLADLLQAHFGVGENYMWGFVAGIDMTGIHEPKPDEWKQGYRDALEAGAALDAAGIKVGWED